MAYTHVVGVAVPTILCSTKPCCLGTRFVVSFHCIWSMNVTNRVSYPPGLVVFGSVVLMASLMNNDAAGPPAVKALADKVGDMLAKNKWELPPRRWCSPTRDNVPPFYHYQHQQLWVVNTQLRLLKDMFR